MKHFLISAVAVAALAIAAPARAQPAPSAPPPGASAPGPAAPSAMPNQMNRMPAGGRATSERGSGVRGHHRRHAVQSAGKSSAGSQADQLNRQELSQLQGTNPTTMNRMSVGGKATSGGPN